MIPSNVLLRRFIGGLMLLLLLCLLACRFEFRNELWFNQDLSGKAEITVIARDLIFADQGEADAKFEENVLQKYEDLINATPGAKLISNENTDLSYGNSTGYQYQLSFSFDSPATLNKIIALAGSPDLTENNIDSHTTRNHAVTPTDAKAVKSSKRGNNTTISFFLPAMSMLENAELVRQIGDLSEKDIHYYLDVHAPAQVTGSSDFDFEPYDENSREWMIAIDEEWFANPIGEYYIEF